MVKANLHLESLIGPGDVPAERATLTVAPAYAFVDGTAINWPVPVTYNLVDGEITVTGMETTYEGEPLVWAFRVSFENGRGGVIGSYSATKAFPVVDAGVTVEYSDMIDQEPIDLPGYGPVYAQQAKEYRDEAEDFAAAAEAVGNTNDTIIAGRVATPASATRTALNAWGNALYAPIGSTGGVSLDDVVAAAGNPETELNSTIVEIVENTVPAGVPVYYTATSLSDARPVTASGQPVYWTVFSDNTSVPPSHIMTYDKVDYVSVQPIPFTPLEFGSALLGWWDEADRHPAAGADYGTLYDQSGLGHNLVAYPIGSPSSATDLPQYESAGINGKPSIFFPPTSGMGVDGLGWGTTPITVFIGAKLATSPTTSETIFNGQDTSSNQSMSLFRSSDGANWVFRRGFSGFSIPHSSAGDGLPHALCAIFNGVSTQLYVDGVLVGTGSGGSGNVTGFKLGLRDTRLTGGSAANQLVNGRLKSPFVVAGVPTADQIAKSTAFHKEKLGTA